MRRAIFKELLSPYGQEVLQAASELAPREVDFLQHFSALSKRYPPDLARLALEIAILRAEGGAKFPFAERMYFTRPALEQASSHPVASYRAERFAGFERVLDLGCSVGGDTLALAAVAPTLGIDRDPLRLAMAQANLQALDLANRVALLQADLTAPLPLTPSPLLPRPPAPSLPSSPVPSLPRSLAIFFDPARRSAGRRVFSVAAYQPPLAIVERWLPRYPALGVKISPGVDLDELRAYDVEIEFISLRGELKEAVLWFGPLKTARRRATLLPGPHSLVSMEVMPPAGGRERRLPLCEPLAYLYEPDPAILRAGLVQDLGLRLGAAQLDPDIAYLTAGQLTSTPFARAWAVEDWLPFNLKRLRAALRQRGVGRVTVKKRGSPLQPDELMRALRLKGEAERVLFLTHLRGRPIVVVCLPGVLL